MLTPNEDGLLFSSMLQKDNSDQPGNCEWRHMCALQPGTRRWLEEELNLDQNVVDAMLASGTRPRMLIRNDGLMVNLRGINLNDPNEPEDMISLRIWIDEHNIVTCRRRDLRAVEEIMELFTEGRGPSTGGQFITTITTRMFNRMEPFIEDLERRRREARGGV